MSVHERRTVTEGAGVFEEGAITSVHVGPIAPLGTRGVPSAFVKHAVGGRVAVGPLGLAGDHQADPSVHGGPEKAVYAYATSSYLQWRAEFPEHEALLVPGGLGENLAIAGLDEANVFLGDVVRAGDAVLQVTQPRQPCFKLGLRFGDQRMLKAMIRSGRSGWYYRVLEPGTIAAGDRVSVIERPNVRWPVARLNRLMATKSATREDLSQLVELPGLASGWQAMAREALAATGRPRAEGC